MLTAEFNINKYGEVMKKSGEKKGKIEGKIEVALEGLSVKEIKEIEEIKKKHK